MHRKEDNDKQKRKKNQPMSDQHTNHLLPVSPSLPVEPCRFHRRDDDCHYHRNHDRLPRVHKHWIRDVFDDADVFSDADVFGDADVLAGRREGGKAGGCRMLE